MSLTLQDISFTDARVLVLCNPRSGRSIGPPPLSLRRANRLRTLLQRGQIAVDLTCPDSAAQATDWATSWATACTRSHPRQRGVIVAVGGDGTVAVVLRGMLACENSQRQMPGATVGQAHEVAPRSAPGQSAAVALAVIGCGTENLIARGLGVTRQVDLLARAIHQRLTAQDESPIASVAHTTNVDVGMLNLMQGLPTTPAQATAFLACVGVGWDAEAAMRLAECRRGLASPTVGDRPSNNNGHTHWGRYLQPLWDTWCRHRFARLTIDADGRRLFDDHGLCLVFNLPRYAWGLRLVDAASSCVVASDGLLDVVALRAPTNRHLLVHAARVLGRTAWPDPSLLAQWPGAVRIRAGTLQITSDQPAAWHADGEPLGMFTRAQLRALPNALPVVHPNPPKPPHSTRHMQGGQNKRDTTRQT